MTASGTIASLADRWNQMCKPPGIPAGISEPALAQLIKRYDEPHRHYHNQQHLSDCFKFFDDIRKELENPLITEMAIWFHDCIYNTQCRDNESRSAAVAMAFLLEAKLVDITKDVTDFIEATTDHQLRKTRYRNDLAFFLDIDLAILGSDSVSYETYEQQIRAEYQWVPEAQYRQARKSVLEQFLQRKPLYYTDHFFEQFETRARQNIETSLVLLTR